MIINNIHLTKGLMEGLQPPLHVSCIGGPPCQAYSVVGRTRMGKAVEEDPRNELYKYYVQFLARYQPKMFVFENVLGIITAKRDEPFAGR